MARLSNKFLHDDEFGDIEIRRVRGFTLRLKIQPTGKIIAQVPRFGTMRDVRSLIEENRQNLRKNLENTQTPALNYDNGAKIGKSHRLTIRDGVRANVSIKNLEIIVTLSPRISAREKTELIKDGVATALRKEAKAYLPRRLRYLSEQTGLRYDRVRFTHAKSRWGSCSTSGTISLNIMLMTLPQELIDYVLSHELTHTKHMDHSAEFWRDLTRICPNAKRKRLYLKQFSPYL